MEKSEKNKKPTEIKNPAEIKKPVKHRFECDPVVTPLWIKGACAEAYSRVACLNRVQRGVCPVPPGGWVDARISAGVQERLNEVGSVVPGHMLTGPMSIVAEYIGGYCESDITSENRLTFLQFREMDDLLCNDVRAFEIARSKRNTYVQIRKSSEEGKGQWHRMNYSDGHLFFFKAMAITLDILMSRISCVSTGDELVEALGCVFQRKYSHSECLLRGCCIVCEVRTSLACVWFAAKRVTLRGRVINGEANMRVIPVCNSVRPSDSVVWNCQQIVSKAFSVPLRRIYSPNTSGEDLISQIRTRVQPIDKAESSGDEAGPQTRKRKFESSSENAYHKKQKTSDPDDDGGDDGDDDIEPALKPAREVIVIDDDDDDDTEDEQVEDRPDEAKIHEREYVMEARDVYNTDTGQTERTYARVAKKIVIDVTESDDELDE